ncbi:MAG: hypothetical protein LBU73_10315 [Helicobacteraceae bacterium]|jgi:hypothetical protein|nr:hypothetical protein [Helicobacteraceae bacterium]
MIQFSRINREPIPVKVEADGMRLEGILTRERQNLVLFSGRLTGDMRLLCDLCAAEFVGKFDEPVRLFISDGEWAASDEEIDEAVLETRGAIDPAEILQGEIAALECDYHKCEKCKAAGGFDADDLDDL